ncbi:tRNA:m(4)X modification enzyme TRM13 homolog [Sabethes cyaneus]|uniref:tRNA:m(4)X modification enzyme TRM13 homolog n=1 Tax=Sabethes cyaneus TaxID=53552 RepID=UPI00237E6F96|nr:tRNA:m(4)X modification enzyme TRM13 homolog [Sabethes cyaneus]
MSSTTTTEEPAEKRPKVMVQQEETPTRCQHFVQRKKRYCKMTVGRGKQYCGEHEPQRPPSTTTTGDESETGTDRIPCPLDPKHSISATKLDKHLRICNARPVERPVFIQPNVNAASDGEDDNSQSEGTAVNERKLADVPQDELNGLIAKIEAIYSGDCRINAIEEMILQHAAFREELTNPSYGPQTLKHLTQSASLLGIVEREGFLRRDTAFVEFGAGKGQVAFWLATVIQQSVKDELANTKVVLVDRASHRHKQDNRIEDRQIVERIRADIGDLVLKKLDVLRGSKNVVGLGKHLCGGATDLALRCLVKAKESSAGGNGEYLQVSGFVFALCCHHRCDWKSYTGRKFLLDRGIVRDEFELMVRMVSWAVCGTGTSREKRKVQLDGEDGVKYGLTRSQREKVGRKCKRVLDLGRIEYLTANGFNSQLKQYSKSEITLENVCLIGHFNKSS